MTRRQWTADELRVLDARPISLMQIVMGTVIRVPTNGIASLCIVA